MKNNLFDIFIKDKLTQYKPSVPKHLWDKIAEENENRRRLFFFNNGFSKAAAVLLILITVGGLSYILLNKNYASPTGNIVKQNYIPKSSTNLANISNTSKISPNTNIAKSQSNHVDIVPFDETDFDKVYHHKLNNAGKLSIKITASIPTLTDIEDENKSIPKRYLIGSITPVDKINNKNNFNPRLQLTNLPSSLNIPDLLGNKNEAGNKKYVEFYAGADYVFKTYQDGDANYISKRRASTALNYATTIGARYTKVFKNGSSIKTGVNYSRVSEKFFAKNGYVVHEVASLNAFGDTVGNYLLKTPLYENKNNVYHSVDIPVQMGYEIGNGKWHTNISAGASINVYSKQRASVVNKDGLSEDVTSGKSLSRYRYKTKAGVSLLASIGIYYKVNKNTHVLAEPYLRYSLSPANLPTIDLKQKIHTTGVRLGLRKDL